MPPPLAAWINADQRQVPTGFGGMVPLHLGKQPLEVRLLFAGRMLLDESRESPHVRVDVRWQPHGCSGSAGGKVRGSMCKAVVPKRADYLRPDLEIGCRIRKRPARHRIGAEGQRDHRDDGLLVAFAARRTDSGCQRHGLPFPTFEIPTGRRTPRRTRRVISTRPWRSQRDTVQPRPWQHSPGGDDVPDGECVLGPRSSERPASRRGHCAIGRPPGHSGSQVGEPVRVRVYVHVCGQPAGESSHGS